MGIRSLTEKEKEVLLLLGTGKTDKEIASELFISNGVVKKHTGVIYEKLELRGRTQAAIYANIGYLPTVEDLERRWDSMSFLSREE